MLTPASRGFSLIETSIAMLLLAIGVVGAAGIQFAVLRAHQQSQWHTAALQLGSEMAELIRLYAGSFEPGDESNPFLKIEFVAGKEVPESMNRNCHVRYCSVSEMTHFELKEWKRRFSTLLPGGTVIVCRDAKPTDDESGNYRWSCTSPTAGEAALAIKIAWSGKPAAVKPAKPIVVLMASMEQS